MLIFNELSLIFTLFNWPQGNLVNELHPCRKCCISCHELVFITYSMMVMKHQPSVHWKQHYIKCTVKNCVYVTVLLFCPYCSRHNLQTRPNLPVTMTRPQLQQNKLTPLQSIGGKATQLLMTLLSWTHSPQSTKRTVWG